MNYKCGSILLEQLKEIVSITADKTFNKMIVSEKFFDRAFRFRFI